MNRKFIFSLLTCIMSLSLFATPVVFAKESTTKVENVSSKYSYSLLYSLMEKAWTKADEHNIKLTSFKEREKVLKLCKKTSLADFEDIPVLEKVGSRYQMDQSNYGKFIYDGEFESDSRPHGFGILYKQNSLFPEPLVKYIGYFNHGRFEGYGVEFLSSDPSDEQDSFVLVMGYSNSTDVYNTLNVHEGYFKKGYSDGKGIDYSMTYDETKVDQFEPTRDDIEYDYLIGDYNKKGINGDLKYFVGYSLAYEGDVKNNKYDGFGKQYYLYSDQLKYEGEFKQFQYHGTGILYDLDGSILAKGKFVNGQFQGRKNKTKTLKVTVEEVLENPRKYNGITVKLQGSFPQSQMVNKYNQAIYAIKASPPSNSYIEIIGKEPDIWFCEGYVYGTIVIEEGLTKIYATSFELIKVYTSVSQDNSQNSSSSQSGQNNQISMGNYIANFNMTIRQSPDQSSNKVGSLKQSEIVYIEEISTGMVNNVEGIWGKTNKGWICISDGETDFMSPSN